MADLTRKVRTALNETRTLILGAQILLGFQYQSSFQERFEPLAAPARVLDGSALALMLVSVGLLIAPATLHRIGEDGQSTGAIMHLTGRCAAAALLPFSLALGLDVAIAVSLALDSGIAGGVAGGAFALVALAAWFGLGEVMMHYHGGPERREAEEDADKREHSPLHSLIEQMLTEARVILPGAQALLGFQLIIVMTGAFENLPASSRLLHGAALLCIAFSVILLITPAALHRIVWAGEDSETLLHTGGRITMAALVPLALGMTGDAYVVFQRITQSTALAGAATAIVLAGLSGLWLAWPLARRRNRR